MTFPIRQHLSEHKIQRFISLRYSDGSVRLRNPNIELMDQDILYHLALGSGSHDLVEMFGDVKASRIGILRADNNLDDTISNFDI